MSQTNVQEGDILLTASENLVGGRLVKITNNSGSAEASLPDNATDEAAFVVVDDTDSGEYVTIRPLSPTQSVRIRLDGTCNPGDQLVSATPNGTNDGKVITLPATAGTYRLIGIAEEAGVDEQLVKVRPVGQRLITVT